MTIAHRAYVDSLNRRRRGEPRTLAGSLAWQVKEARAQRKQLVFPLAQFDRPGGIKDFAHLVLGVRVSRVQEKIFEQVEQACAPNAVIKRIVVQSCVKAGKTFTIGIIGLWRYCCIKDSRTVLTGPREDSINIGGWKEIKKLVRYSGVCYPCRQQGHTECDHSGKVPGKCSIEAKPGLKGLGFAEIFGVIAAQEEGLQGISDPTLMIIGDEAVAIRETFYQALSGNMVSSVTGCEIWFANPNRIGGWFHRACTALVDRWRWIKIAAHDVWDEGIPGLATKKSVQIILDDFGASSDPYRIRVLGEFPLSAAGGLFTEQLLADARARWTEKRSGFVIVGVDPASSTGTGDATGFCVRVADSIQLITTEIGLEAEDILERAIELANQYTDGDYTIAYDRGGTIGFDLHRVAMARRKATPRMFLQPIHASDKSPTPAFNRVRDLLVEKTRQWLKQGALCENEDFEAEAKAFSFSQGVNGKTVASSKQKLRQILGRSPDSFDAVALACFVDREPQRRAAAPAPAKHRYDSNQRNEVDDLRSRAY